VIQVAEGCGPGRWRGPWGGCRGPDWGPGPYAPPPPAYYGGRYYGGNGCPPGFWHGPWGIAATRPITAACRAGVGNDAPRLPEIPDRNPHPMKLLAPIAVAAALLAAPLLPSAYAQQAPAAQTPQIPEWTEADGRAALRTVVEMTPAQQALWAPVEASIREISQGAIVRRNQRQAATAPASFLDVLGAIADAEEARGRELRKFVDATRPFVASLTDAPKRRIPAFLGMTDHGGPGQPSGSLWLFEDEEG
jgi:hypothetical protein